MSVLARLVELLPLLFGLGALGLALLALRRVRLGGALAGAAAALLALGATPLASDALRGALEARFPPRPAAEAPAADAIVLLGGGVAPPAPPREVIDLRDPADRVLHAARLYRAGKAPVVVASGGAASGGVSQAAAMADFLGALGVPRGAVLLEERSRSTYENARHTRALLAEHGLEEVLLVTSALHMPRALATFRSAGVRAHPAATDHGVVERHDPLVARLLPGAPALAGSARAWHELVGALVYRARGWIERG